MLSISDLYRTSAYRFIYPGMTALLAGSALVLSSCSRHETSWMTVRAPAPLIAQGQPATVYQQCNGGVMGASKQCVLAFGTSTGDKLLVSDLVQQLDQTLMNASETQGWPVGQNQKRKMAYNFTILSIEPTIAVGYPVMGTAASSGCTALFPRGNCLASGKFDGYYRIGTSVPSIPGLAWFSPEHGNRLFSVPQHSNSIFFMINGHEARMKRAATQWSFNRGN